LCRGGNKIEGKGHSLCRVDKKTAMLAIPLVEAATQHPMRFQFVKEFV
jgi:hypothetical protein